MRQNDVSGGIIITPIVVLLFIGAMWLLLKGVTMFGRRLLGGQTPKRVETELAEPPARASTPAWLWLLLILGFAFIFWQFTPKQGGANRRPDAGSSARLWILLGVGVTTGVVSVLFYLIRATDSGVRRAQRRADAGDLEGAIEDLREQIELKGATQDRTNVLGILLLRAEKWDEAAALFRKAEELGAVKGVCRANLGLALVKAGRPDEALPVLQEVARSGPLHPVLASLVAMHSAQALVALGRWDEARAQFRQAEAMVQTVPHAQRAMLVKEIEGLRWIEHGPPVPETSGRAEE